jgi:L,D-peptidoglycan transpeptidase YkuD (ErfK/YbiS/YcfS/YnhG family)
VDILVSPDGHIDWHGRTYPCALGRGGIVDVKVEGDGATPSGRFPLRHILFRPDRLDSVTTALPTTPIFPDDGWCDDPSHPAYNTPVGLPFTASHESLWRDDALYDVVVVIGHNDSPPTPGHGSAIFMHIATPDYAPTAGCVALRLDHLLEILAACGPQTFIKIAA